MQMRENNLPQSNLFAQFSFLPFPKTGLQENSIDYYLIANGMLYKIKIKTQSLL